MSVYYIQMDINLKEKAIFSKNLSPGNMYNTFDYIPGSVSWGTFATRFSKSDMQKFYDTFFQEKVIFTNLYPAIDSEVTALPLPLSTFACKHKPGNPRNIDIDGEKHNFYDYLLDISRLERRCPLCQSIKKNFVNGFYYKEKEGNTYYSYKVKKTVDMHNHIDDESQSTKKDNGLYSYEPLIKGQKFRGYIILKGEWDNFKDVIKIIESMNNKEISIGKGRNNGYGLSIINILFDESYKLNDDKRLYMDDKLDLSNSSKFTLTLLSDLFIRDNYGNYYTYIDELLLSNILNNGHNNQFLPDNFELTRSFCRSKEVDGFNMKHKLPKNKMIGLQKGSSFCFKYFKLDSQLLSKRLLEIERNGIGLRKSEGYGMIAINLPYDMENIG